MPPKPGWAAAELKRADKEWKQLPSWLKPLFQIGKGKA